MPHPPKWSLPVFCELCWQWGRNPHTASIHDPSAEVLRHILNFLGNVRATGWRGACPGASSSSYRGFFFFQRAAKGSPKTTRKFVRSPLEITSLIYRLEGYARPRYTSGSSVGNTRTRRTSLPQTSRTHEV
jgi:hypothetical protein